MLQTCYALLLSLTFLSSFLYADMDSLFFEEEELARDLAVADYWTRKAEQAPPFLYNHYLLGGYLNTPSARVTEEGTLAFGASFMRPYMNYNLAFQILPFVSVSGNYRIFKGIEDPQLSPFGFGDYADKGANLKIALLKPEDSEYRLPGFAIGFEDFLGTKKFSSKFFVLTQMFPQYGLELSLGLGGQRLGTPFGGIAWSPWYKRERNVLQGLTFLGEYDSTKYKRDPHPRGRQRNSYWNYGIQYRLWDLLTFSCGQTKGKDLSGALSFHYNVGETKGLFPKVESALPYKSPVNYEKIGEQRPAKLAVDEMAFVFEEQGFLLHKATLTSSLELCLLLENQSYRSSDEAKERLTQVLVALTPMNIRQVRVTLFYGGLFSYQYVFPNTFLLKMRQRKMGLQELMLLTQRKEASSSFPKGKVLYRYPKKSFNFLLEPRTRSWFGSSRGKYKYDVSLEAGPYGFLPFSIYYQIVLSYRLASNFEDVGSVDRVNPSQIVNVASDLPLYRKHDFNLERAFLQKSWNLGCGYYARASLGYYETLYGGAAAEFLYFPARQPWAIGLEGALLKKRAYQGLGFQKQLRKLIGFHQTHIDFQPYQYFMNLYYDLPEAKLLVKAKLGQFVARDYGVRMEVTRFFSSGFSLSAWYTVTNTKDVINGDRYFDKGISFSMPLDFFYLKRSRRYWGYGISAWLRDVGYASATGTSLFETLYAEKQ